MANKAISELIATGAIVGTELVEVSKLSTTIKITAATLSALASDNSFNDSGSGFVAAGFAAGDRVNIVGFTGNVANNIVSAKITALTTAKMTIGGVDGDVIVDDAAGETVTITKWTSTRSSVTSLGGAPSGHDGLTTLSIAAGAITLDHSLGADFDLTLSANVTTVNHSNLTSSSANWFSMRVKQDGTGSRTFAPPASWKYGSGVSAYTATATANHVDLINGVTYDNGTTWMITYQKDFT